MNKQQFLDSLQARRTRFAKLPGMAEDARDIGPGSVFVEPTPTGEEWIKSMPVTGQIQMLGAFLDASSISSSNAANTNAGTMYESAMVKNSVVNLATRIIDTTGNNTQLAAKLIDYTGVYLVSKVDAIDNPTLDIFVDIDSLLEGDVVTIAMKDQSTMIPVVTLNIWHLDNNGIMVNKQRKLGEWHGLKHRSHFMFKMGYGAEFFEVIGPNDRPYSYARRTEALLNTIYKDAQITDVVYGTRADVSTDSWAEVTGIVDKSVIVHDPSLGNNSIELVSANPVSFTKNGGIMIGDHTTSSVANGSIELVAYSNVVSNSGVLTTFTHKSDNYAIVGGNEASNNTDQTLYILKLNPVVSVVASVDTTGTSKIEVDVRDDNVLITEFQTNGDYSIPASIRTLSFTPSRNALTPIAITATDFGIVDFVSFGGYGDKYYFVWGNNPGTGNVVLYKKTYSGLFTKVNLSQSNLDDYFNVTPFVAVESVDNERTCFLVMNASNSTISIIFTLVDGAVVFEQENTWYDHSQVVNSGIGTRYLDNYRQVTFSNTLQSSMIWQQLGKPTTSVAQNRPSMHTVAHIEPTLEHWVDSTAYHSVRSITIESHEYMLCVSSIHERVDIVSPATFQVVATINLVGIESADYYTSSSMHRIIASTTSGSICVYEISVARRALHWKLYDLNTTAFIPDGEIAPQ